MDAKNVGLVVCLTLVIVVGINAAIYALVYKGDALHQIELLRHAAQRLKSPWEDEKKALSELSIQVEKFKQEAKNKHGQE